MRGSQVFKIAVNTLDKIVDEVNKELTEKENLMVELKNLKNVKKKSPRQEQSISILEAVIDNMK
jgi:hypothetical protein